MAIPANIYFGNIETATIENKFYRKVLYTTTNQQLVLMSIRPKEDIKLETHDNNDQFIRIEKGSGLLLVGHDESKSKYELSNGIAFIIPARTLHHIINTSDSEDLKLYTIYSPPHHPENLEEMERPKSTQCGGINNSNYGKFISYKRKNDFY